MHPIVDDMAAVIRKTRTPNIMGKAGWPCSVPSMISQQMISKFKALQSAHAGRGRKLAWTQGRGCRRVGRRSTGRSTNAGPVWVNRVVASIENYTEWKSPSAEPQRYSVRPCTDQG